MSGKGKDRALFIEEDVDDVATNSTVESEPQSVYGVDKILAEQKDEEGIDKFLIKWERYPLGESTWEPESNIVDSSIMEKWRAEQRRIQQEGIIDLAAWQATAVDAWQEAAEASDWAKLDRKRRRKAKRRRLGLPVSPDSDGEKNDGDGDGDGAKNDDDDVNGSNGHTPLFIGQRTPSPEREPLAKTRKRVKQPEVRRKGIARKVRRRATTDAASSSEAVSSPNDSSGGDSLFEEIQATQKSTHTSEAPKRRLRVTSVPSDDDSDDEPLAKRRPRKPATTAKASVPTNVKATEGGVAKTTTSTAPVALSSSTKTAKTATIAAPKKPVPPTPAIATSSAPKAKRTGGPGNIFGNWDADKSRRQRQRVSGATPKDSTDPKFHYLSTQHKYQMYGRIERAPDLSALKIVDPKTGKTTSSTTVTNDSGTGNIHSAYARRSPPRDKSPEHRPSKPSLPEQSIPGPVHDSSADTPVRAAPSAETTAPAQRELTFAEKLKQETCWYWTQNICKFDEANCPRAHRNTGISESSKNVTCFYWHEQGWCSRTDENCRFAHFATGKVAPAPPGYHFSAERRMSGPMAAKMSGPTAADSSKVADRGGSRPAPRPQGALPPLEIPTAPSAPGRGEILTPRGPAHGARPAPPRPQGALPPLDTSAPLSAPGRGEISTPRGPAHGAAPASALDVPTKEITCYFWRQGRCVKPDDVCQFAHRDTGIYAGQPGSFKKALPSTGLASNPNPVPVADRENVAVERARELEIPAADRRDGWMQPKVVQMKDPDKASPDKVSPDKASPMHLTGSPIRGALASPRETAGQLNSLGAAMPRRASVPTLSMKATLVFSFQEESPNEETDVKLHILNDAVFKTLAGTDPTLRIKYMVTSSDFEHLLWNDELRDVESSSGGVSVEDGQTPNIDTLTDVCKTHVAGLVAYTAGYSSKMLIYPANAEEWKFLGQEHQFSSGCVLRFRLFEDLPGSPVPGPRLQAFSAVDERPAAQRLGEELINLNPEMFFPTTSAKDGPRAVFLMMPQTHQAELAVLIKYFAALDCKVYHSGDPGAWRFFRKRFGKSCPVIVHSDVQLWRIPGLFQFLSIGAPMFSFGVNSTVALLEERDREFGCERLFPFGTVVYITDETFLNDPDQASEVIRTFLNSHKSKPFGGKNDRIAARPGVMEWLYDLVVAKASERGRRDNRWMKLYSSMCRLARLDLDDEDPDSPEPGSDVPLYLITEPPEFLPTLTDLDGLEDGGVAASDFAVNWFAGWSLLHASRFRKFVICHEPSADMTDDVTRDEKAETDPRGWGMKYQHLGVIPPRVAMQFVKKK